MIFLIKKLVYRHTKKAHVEVGCLTPPKNTSPIMPDCFLWYGMLVMIHAASHIRANQSMKHNYRKQVEAELGSDYALRNI